MRFIRSREIFYKLLNIYKNSRFYAFFVPCILEGYFYGSLMKNQELRRKQLLQYIRRRSGRRFTVAVMAKEFGVSERTIQDDLALLKAFRQIRRTPSYNSLHRQNGNIIVYSGSRKRQSYETNYG